MAILLDEGQAGIVATKRLKPSQRPKYYSSAAGYYTVISDDFEAFLILQGRARNKATVDWVQEATNYSIKDADRDALISFALDNELEDATNGYTEIQPIVDQFNTFKTYFNMIGFESVVECGLLLDDLQRPMNELMGIYAKHRHRIQCSIVVKNFLLENGMTQAQSKQLKSWFDPLTAY
jgi:hypothetical protein